MNEEERNAIEYLKTRLYGNEGCKYIDVAQEDLRIFINLVDRKEKDIEGWKKHCEEIEEEQTEMSNKNCELEFEVEKLQKENEELKTELERQKDINIIINQKGLEKNYEKALEKTMTKFLKNNIDKDVIPVQRIKEKIEEEKLPLTIVGGRRNRKTLEYGIKLGRRQVLQELIEESEEK